MPFLPTGWHTGVSSAWPWVVLQCWCLFVAGACGNGAMVLALLFLLQAAAPEPYRVLKDYNKVPIHAKACAEGLVVYRRKMKDGDWHVTITDPKGRKLVLEIIPEFPLDPPKKGSRILGCGIGRYDVKHKWPEIHPLLKWEQKE